MAMQSQPPNSPNSHPNRQQWQQLTGNFDLSNLELEVAFDLITHILPLGICRHYQIVPLTVQDYNLTLGIVDLEHPDTFKGVRSHLQGTPYNIQYRKIDLKTYQLIISAYLNYAKTESPAHKLPKTSALNPYSSLTSAPSNQSAPDIRATFIVDSPDDSYATGDLSIDSGFIYEQSKYDLPSSSGKTNSGFSLGQVNPDYSRPLNQSPSIGRNTSGHQVPPKQQPATGNQPPHNTSHNTLNLKADHLAEPIQSLLHLPAKQLWHELLARVLNQGIGRIYFERYPTSGRILLTQNGVLQAACEQLAVSQYQALLNQFKMLAHLPPDPVDKPKKIEIEHYYQNERVLLRLRVTQGKHGEEGTLQVLRGNALQFYQQKQMDELGEQALHLSQELERKLRQIYARTRINPTKLNQIHEIWQLEAKIRQLLEQMSHNPQ